jgi:hypothetical protein
MLLFAAWMEIVDGDKKIAIRVVENGEGGSKVVLHQG